MAKTRRKKKIFLLDQVKDELCHDQLPTVGDVLKHLYHLKSENPTIKEKNLICCGFSRNFQLRCDIECSCLLKILTTIYGKAGIETIRVDAIQKKIENLNSQYKKLVSLQKRNSQKEVEKRKNFCDMLSLLFDIMPLDVVDTIEKDKKRTKEDKAEDVKFINDQRGPRKMFIGQEDQRYTSSAQRSYVEKNMKKT